MKCKYCGDDMKLYFDGGDGYYEPRETIYKCSCGAEHVNEQAYGEYWVNNKGEVEWE